MIVVGLQPTVIASRAPHLLLEQSVRDSKNRGRASPVNMIVVLHDCQLNFVRLKLITNSLSKFILHEEPICDSNLIHYLVLNCINTYRNSDLRTYWSSFVQI